MMDIKSFTYNTVKAVFVNIVKVIFVNIVKVLFVNIVWMRMFWLGAACTCQAGLPWICLPPQTFTIICFSTRFFLIFSTVVFIIPFQLKNVPNIMFEIYLQYFKEKLPAVCACQPYFANHRFLPPCHFVSPSHNFHSNIAKYLEYPGMVWQNAEARNICRALMYIGPFWTVNFWPFLWQIYCCYARRCR